MNQPDVVLFEKIYCWSQSNTWCVHISSLYTSSQSTGMSTCSNDCNVCGKHFKRLESHLSQNLACKSYYMSRCVNAAATVAPNIPNDSNHVNTSHVLQGASRSCLNLRSPSTFESHWILQLCNESSTPIAQCRQRYQLGWMWWQNANDSRDHANLTEID